jgi:hypothetical protein
MVSFHEASADTFAQEFPELGLFSAEDIVTWRDSHGAFPTEDEMVKELGIDATIAAKVARELSAAGGAPAPAAAAPPKAAGLADPKDDSQDEIWDAAPPKAAAPPAAAPTLGLRDPKDDSQDELWDVAPPKEVAPPNAAAAPEPAVSEAVSEPSPKTPPPLPPGLGPTSAASPPSDGPLVRGPTPDRAPSSGRPATPAIVGSIAKVTGSDPPEPRFVTFGASEGPARVSAVPAVATLLSSHPSALVSAAVAHARASLVPHRRSNHPTSPSGDALEKFVEDVRPSTEITTTSAQATPPPDSEMASAVPPPPMRRSFATPILFAVAFAANLGLAAGLLQTRNEERRAVAPIAGISTDVKQLHGAEHDLRKQIADTRSELADTRSRVDKHATVIEITAKKVDEVIDQSKAIERALRDTDARERRDQGSLSARLARLEKKSVDGTVSLTDALHTIDAIQGPPAVHPPKDAPAPKAEPHEPTPHHGE